MRVKDAENRIKHWSLRDTEVQGSMKVRHTGHMDDLSPSERYDWNQDTAVTEMPKLRWSPESKEWSGR